MILAHVLSKAAKMVKMSWARQGAEELVDVRVQHVDGERSVLHHGARVLGKKHKRLPPVIVMLHAQCESHLLYCPEPEQITTRGKVGWTLGLGSAFLPLEISCLEQPLTPTVDCTQMQLRVSVHVKRLGAIPRRLEHDEILAGPASRS